MRMYTPDELDRIAALVQRGPADGYPALADRLFSATTNLFVANPGDPTTGPYLYVPDGPWHVTGHQNRHGHDLKLMDLEMPDGTFQHVDPKLSRQWHTDGLMLDQYGRPLHPYWRQLLADPRIGLPTGIGYFWRYGPNRTVSSVAYRPGPEVLLIKRRSGGQWALPGGFQDRGDLTNSDTALRELREETGLEVVGATFTMLGHEIIAGPLATLNAWTEDVAVMVHADPVFLASAELKAGDDATDARWFPVHDALKLDLFDIHDQYINAGMATWLQF